MNNTFGTRLYQLMQERRINQRELAQAMHSSLTTINSWLQDKSKPNSRNITKLSRYFNVTSNFLLGIDDKKTIDISDLDEASISIIMLLVNQLKTLHNNNLDKQ